MAVKYAGGGGWGIWDILGTIASVAIPGAAPFVAGAKALGGLLNGDPGQAAMQAVGMFAPTKGVPSPGASPSGFSAPDLASKMNSIGPAAGAQVADVADAGAQVADVADAGAQVADVADAGAQVADASKYAQLVKQYGYGDNPETDWTARQQMNKGNPVVDQTRWNDLLTRYPTLFRRR